MNIGIDARLLGEKITGITRYLINVLKYLPDYDSQNNYSLFAYSKTMFDKNFYIHHLVRDFKLPRQIKEHFWLNLYLPRLLKENNIDLFFTPYVLVPFKRSTQKNVIVIHDVMTQACGQFFTTFYKKYMSVVVPQAIKRSDAIVTVSESAKNDIIKYYNVSSDNITVMYLWSDENYKPLDINTEQRKYIIRKYNLPEQFILYVGAIEERKNIIGILKISDILKYRNVDTKIVLLGIKGFGFDRLNDEIKVRADRVQLIDYVPENDLPLIYNLAKIFLFPSFYEGFGLPPLEAMKCGLPTLAGKNSSLIEVVGEGGLLFDAKDYNAFADSIVSLLDDAQFYASMKNRALKKSGEFKPESEIIKLINLFNSLN
jgi:glycosyltransferase involved in cell wall biosynthesis